MYEGLSDEIKDALVTSRPQSNSRGHLIQICRELVNRIRTRAAEWVQPGHTQRLPCSGPSSASTPTLAPANPTGTNSGHYGVAPMDLSAMQRTAEKNRIRQERMARGECLYCGTVGHFLHECPERAASRNRRLAMATTVNMTAEPASGKKKLCPERPDALGALDASDATCLTRTQFAMALCIWMQLATVPCVQTQLATASAYQTEHVRAFSFWTQPCQGIFLMDAAVSGHFPSGRSRVRANGIWAMRVMAPWSRWLSRHGTLQQILLSHSQTRSGFQA